MPGHRFLAHWYYYVPDWILAALIWLLIARLASSLLVHAESAGAASRLLKAATDPVLRVIGAITPKALPPPLVILCAAAWLLAARVALFIAVSATGVRLSMG